MSNTPRLNVHHVSTGFSALDQMTGGLKAGDLIVVAARPGIGKRALASSIAEHVSFAEKLPVAIFSTAIEGTAELIFSELSVRARASCEQLGMLGLIVVDYLQLMNGGKQDGKSRATELSGILGGLKLLAKELRCPVMVLSQVNRSVEYRRDKRPMLSDLREVDAIERHADLVMFVYCDNHYFENSSRDPEAAEIIIAKHRNGPTGTVELSFSRSLATFDSLARITIVSGGLGN